MSAYPGTKGQTLTFKQIEDLWIVNGGNPAWAPTMAGIAEAESGGMTNNLNANASTGDFSVGLWQINYFGSLGPERAHSFGEPATLADDVNLQAKAAISLLGGGAGITNWKGDPVGNYAQDGKPLSLATVQSIINKKGGPGFIGQAESAAVAAANFASGGLIHDAQTAVGVASSAGTALSDFGTIAEDLSSAAFWKRIGVFVLGAATLVTGLVIFLADNDQVRQDVTTGATLAAA